MFDELLAGDFDFCRSSRPPPAAAPDVVVHSPAPLIGISASVRCWWYRAAAAAAAAYGVAGGVYGPGAPVTLDDGGGGAPMPCPVAILEPRATLPPPPPAPPPPPILVGELDDAAAAAAENMLVFRLGHEKALLVGGGTLAAALAQPFA